MFSLQQTEQSGKRTYHSISNSQSKNCTSVPEIACEGSYVSIKCARGRLDTAWHSHRSQLFSAIVVSISPEGLKWGITQREDNSKLQDVQCLSAQLGRICFLCLLATPLVLLHWFQKWGPTSVGLVLPLQNHCKLLRCITTAIPITFCTGCLLNLFFPIEKDIICQRRVSKYKKTKHTKKRQ